MKSTFFLTYGRCIWWDVLWQNEVLTNVLVLWISYQRKRSLCLLSKNCNDLELKIYYKHYCTVLSWVVREAKKLYYNELITHLGNKVQVTWKIIKNLTGRIQNSQHVSPTFKVDGKSSPINKQLRLLIITFWM